MTGKRSADELAEGHGFESHPGLFYGDCMNLTHAVMWEKHPREKNIFVSKYISLVLPILKRDKNVKKVLDVACGNGLGVSLPLLRKGYKVYAFDKFSSAVKAAKRNTEDEGYKLNVSKADMYKPFPYRDNSFDTSFCFQAIYHGNINQIMFALSEMKRVTKKGGYIFVNFLPFEIIHYDKKKKKYFNYTTYTPQQLKKRYAEQDKHFPHLFRFKDKLETNVPHYFMSKEEVKSIAGQYLTDIKIIKVKKDKSDKWFYWLAYGKA